MKSKVKHNEDLIVILLGCLLNSYYQLSFEQKKVIFYIFYVRTSLNFPLLAIDMSLIIIKILKKIKQNP
jgi:hypothetical protein